MRSFKGLDNQDKKKVRSLARHKCAFLSPTISPAPADVNLLEPEKSKLESLDSAIELMLEHGVENIVVQIKAMGSRGTMYLSDKREECYVSTRNGFTLKGRTDQEREQIAVLLDEWHEWYINSDRSVSIIDGELMPWSFLAKDLVERSFAPHYILALEKLSSVVDNPKAMEVLYGGKSNWVKHKNAALNYARQYKKFISDNELSFHAFDVLDHAGTMAERNRVLGSLPMCVNRHIEGETHVLSGNVHDMAFIEKVTALIKRTEELALEGVVIKPADDHIGDEGIPAIKLRNDEYLKLVYGYDYMVDLGNYQKLCVGKDVDQKVKMSIKQNRYAQRMLKVPYAERNSRNEYYVHLIEQAVLAAKNLELLDSRL